MSYKLYKSKRKNKRRRRKKRMINRKHLAYKHYASVFSRLYAIPHTTPTYFNFYLFVWETVKSYNRVYVDFYFYLVDKNFKFLRHRLLTKTYNGTNFVGFNRITRVINIFKYSKINKILSNQRAFIYSYIYLKTFFNYYNLPILNKSDYVHSVGEFYNITPHVSFIQIQEYLYPSLLFIHSYVSENWNADAVSVVKGELFFHNTNNFLKIIIIYYKIYLLNVILLSCK